MPHAINIEHPENGICFRVSGLPPEQVTFFCISPDAGSSVAISWQPCLITVVRIQYNRTSFVLPALISSIHLVFIDVITDTIVTKFRKNGYS